MSTVDARLERLGALLTRKLGLRFDDVMTGALSDALRDRAEASDLDAYLARLEGPEGRDEIRGLVRDLTVGETYFFRNADQFQALEHAVLPAVVKARAGRAPVRILSAGCASGEEAYSLAITARERSVDLGLPPLRLDAFDLNPSVVSRAVAGRYSSWSLRSTPAEMAERYFRRTGRDYQLDDAIRSMVSFEERNLMEDDPVFWREGTYDVVFCRNVLMYFAPDAVRAVVARIARSLVPGGFLFLGHAETLRGVSQEFHLCHTHESFYYQRRAEGEAPGETTPRASLPNVRPADRPAPRPLEAGDTSWIQTIERASERVAQLSRGPSSLSSGKVPEVAGAWDLRPAVELLRRERFGDAMALLEELPEASHSDPDAQILRAVLLTNGGKVPEAERVCRQILAQDDLHAGARYLLALCREHAGDRAAAMEHCRAASYLDAAFAMPHLHLGLLARRTGDREAARRALRQAVALLEREDGARILLFGGGFTREALVDLCRSELRACGGDR
jgi:chemotaxis protein methyltransferase CheR